MAGSSKGNRKKNKKKLNHQKPDAMEKQSGNTIRHTNLNSKQNDNSERGLEKELYEKIELLYNKALDQLLALRFSKDVASKAILMSGYIFGKSNILRNIVLNSIAAIKNGHIIDGQLTFDQEPIFKDISELVKFSTQTLINEILIDRPDLQKSDALLLILSSNSLAVDGYIGNCSQFKDETSSTTTSLKGKKIHQSGTDIETLLKETSSFLQKMSLSYNPSSSIQSKEDIPSMINPQIESNLLRNDEPSKTSKLDSFDFVKSLANCPDEVRSEDWLRTASEDQKADLMMDLANQVDILRAKAKETKEWAEERVIKTAKRLNSDILELRRLRSEKIERERLRQPKEELAPANYVAAEKESGLRRIYSELDSVHELIRNLKADNLKDRSDIQSFKSSRLEAEKLLQEVRNRERKNLKKLKDTGKEISELKRQIEEEKLSIVEVEQQLLQVNEAQQQEKLRMTQDLEEEDKEQADTLVLEEERLNKIEKKELESRLESLQQELGMNQPIELSQQKQSQDSSNALPFGASRAFSERCSSSQGAIPPRFDNRLCLICKIRDACILFQPCAHQVICDDCNEVIFDALDNLCPCCNHLIEKRVKVYGPRV